MWMWLRKEQKRVYTTKWRAPIYQLIVVHNVIRHVVTSRRCLLLFLIMRPAYLELSHWWHWPGCCFCCLQLIELYSLCNFYRSLLFQTVNMERANETNGKFCATNWIAIDTTHTHTHRHRKLDIRFHLKETLRRSVSQPKKNLVGLLFAFINIQFRIRRWISEIGHHSAVNWEEYVVTADAAFVWYFVPFDSFVTNAFLLVQFRFIIGLLLLGIVCKHITTMITIAGRNQSMGTVDGLLIDT